MDAKAIETFVTSYIEQSLQGLEKENPKFDFKALWYDLKNPKDVSEFLKDTTSIANTFGPDGFIVIGFNDKKKEFTQATFKDCKLRDSADIINLINGKVDRLFVVNTIDIEFKGNKLSVIHIPPSLDKPHVIKNYVTYDNGQPKKDEENKIWVRKNSRTNSASKYDIDLMYYDRKNIEPDYELHANYNISTTVFNLHREDKLIMTSHFTIENTGRRPVAIAVITVKIEFGNEPSTENFVMISDSKYIGNNIIIGRGEIWNGRLDFASVSNLHFVDNPARNMKHKYYSQERSNIRNSNLELKLANGTTIYAGLEKIG